MWYITYNEYCFSCRTFAFFIFWKVPYKIKKKKFPFRRILSGRRNRIEKKWKQRKRIGHKISPGFYVSFRGKFPKFRDECSLYGRCSQTRKTNRNMFACQFVLTETYWSRLPHTVLLCHRCLTGLCPVIWLSVATQLTDFHSYTADSHF